ncbi:MAG TPA: hypothetical protein VFB33_17270 [Candidatus Binataceae bacterium]|jgi:hypothetical protein|nr:hypothetical protein [Candidatus Binataceae bacterium]
MAQEPAEGTVSGIGRPRAGGPAAPRPSSAFYRPDFFNKVFP